MQYSIEVIDNIRCLDDFDCGVDSINNFFKRESYFQDISKENKTKILLGEENNIIGFYTVKFTVTSIEKDGDISRKSVFEIQYLAIDINYQNSHIGSNLLTKIITDLEKLSTEIGGYGILINALADKVSWYSKNGFAKIKIHGSNDIYTVPMLWNLYDEELVQSYFDEEV